MSASTPLRVAVGEGSSPIYTATLLDADSNPVPLASIAALRLTLRNTNTGSVVNSRNNASILNTNGGTYHATSGALEMRFSPSDMAFDVPGTDQYGDTCTLEATFRATWTREDGSSGGLSWRVVFDIRNMRDA